MKTIYCRKVGVEVVSAIPVDAIDGGIEGIDKFV
jgi:hypothetical protein